ncbi:MAG TPA: helix-turn-helix domain-containing protein [Anaerolineae bacterium]|nr:helix-turn-helix domain-containing protein [Anaerolineae bacterium]
MEEIGRSLLEAREQLGLSLEEAERATRIRVHHLEAIERGEMEAFPTPVQARGFLHNYAEFLGLDANAILLQYAEALQSRRSRLLPETSHKEPGAGPSVRIRSRRPRWLSSDLFFAMMIVLVILAVFIWGGSRVVAMLNQRAETPEAALGLLIPTSTATVTETPLQSSLVSDSTLVPATEETPIPTQPLFLGIADKVNLTIVVKKSAWLKVVVDGDEAFQGRVKEGDVFEFQGDQIVELTTGNGAGIHVFYNGQDHGILGEVGQVVIRLWTLGGALTPTATITRTPTETPRISNTPNPTATPPSTPGG